MTNVKKVLLWPTELYFFNSEDIDNNKIKEIILEKEKTEPSRKLSNIGGWQSQDPLLELEGFSEIKKFLFECTDYIIRDVYQDGIKFDMVSSWSNVNRKGDYNISHIHPNSHWSCAYYITETYSASIFFSDPRTRAGMFGARTSRGRAEKSRTSMPGANLNPDKFEPGQALFFPSWLDHGVYQNSTDNPRISISCNFSLK